MFTRVVLFLAVVRGTSAVDCFSCTVNDSLPFCLPHSHVCDGIDDCDGVDERDCGSEAKCRGFFCSKMCLALKYKCDRIRHCPFGDDELRCSASCVYYENRDLESILCVKSRHCVESSKRCDGREDCPDGDDEVGCDIKGVSLWAWLGPVLIVPSIIAVIVYAKCRKPAAGDTQRAALEASNNGHTNQMPDGWAASTTDTNQNVTLTRMMSYADTAPPGYNEVVSSGAVNQGFQTDEADLPPYWSVAHITAQDDVTRATSDVITSSLPQSQNDIVDANGASGDGHTTIPQQDVETIV